MLEEPIEIHNRYDLHKLMYARSYTRIVEVGVRHGYYSKYILDNTPNTQVWCVDSWSAPDSAGHLAFAKKLLAPYVGYPHYRCFIKQKSSLEAAKEMTDNWFHFIYIDADHTYQSVLDDMNAWWPKVQEGGVLAGHDYSPKWPGVIRAVQEFAKHHNVQVEIIPARDKEATWDNDGGEPSWMIEKV